PMDVVLERHVRDGQLDPVVRMGMTDDDAGELLETDVLLQVGERAGAAIEPYMAAVGRQQVPAARLARTGEGTGAPEDGQRQRHCTDSACASSGPNRRPPTVENQDVSPDEKNRCPGVRASSL